MAADLGPPRRRSGPAPHELIPLIPESIAATLSGRADLLLRIVLELTSADPNTVADRHPALGRGTGSRLSSAELIP